MECIFVHSESINIYRNILTTRRNFIDIAVEQDYRNYTTNICNESKNAYEYTYRKHKFYRNHQSISNNRLVAMY